VAGAAVVEYLAGLASGGDGADYDVAHGGKGLVPGTRRRDSWTAVRQE